MPSGSEESCIHGLPTFEDLKTLSEDCVALEQDGTDEEDTGCLFNTRTTRTYIMPYINFTCDGQITRWMAGGVADTSSPLSENPPRLLVLRGTCDNRYAVASEIPLMSCNGGVLDTVATDLYECSLSSGIEVKSGDLLGITQRYDLSESFRLYINLPPSSLTEDQPMPTYQFNNRPERTCFILRSEGNQLELLPLVALEVQSTGKL